ncbi:hybrid sensor histidine kinase/response regulator [Pedobacter sp. SYSU D00535]|uniref:hybrid sensor histidine kinase/response regulator n=1 Tax=Pedobacter sp. SYSU D00535 TaxID=2810308 RepID=UPI001A96F032|nr:hybrid sensor histidine kinase/response regulator [Pedobacter sp. SYSU D00535]
MRKIKILLVDDDEDDFILTRELLSDSPRKATYELSWCNNYREAITLLLKGLYDIYLVDYRLGSHSGIDLLNEAVKSSCTKPIIILTGKGDSRIDEEALQLGAADYLVKDQIDCATLERSIRYCYGHSKALEQLKESENKFRIIFERSKDPMLITDQKGNIYEANTAALRFFEYSKEAFLRKNAAELYRNKNNRKVFTNSLQGNGSVANLEFEYVTASGKTRVCSISSFVQISKQSDVELYYSILHDITYRRQQEQQIALEEKLSSIERITRNLADEVLNPLSNVNLALDELRGSLTRQEDLLLYEIIRKNCDRISELSTQLVESTQSAPLSIKRIDFVEVLNRTAKEAEGLYDLEININAPKTTIFFYGDEAKLALAIMNIFENVSESLEFKKRGILVNVSETSRDVSLEISDKGIVIPKQDLDKVFEPYFTSKGKSSGLGLAHSQRIIQAHDGQIEIKSGQHEGTTVKITLPRIRQL